jgi:hypothetical protein
MTPNKILIMRHAEKPSDPHNINLAPKGLARAKQLATYIPATFGRPDFLFATQQSPDSNRPLETIEPLAQSSGLNIDDSFADNQYKALASGLITDPKYNGVYVLICWHHEKILKLARALGAKAADLPGSWNPDVYNLILVLDFTREPKPSVKKIFEPF